MLLILFGALSGGALLVGVASLLLIGYHSIDYPDATIVSRHTRTYFSGRPSLRQDASYRTTDHFPAIYNWYSNGFDLGPESKALSQCSLLEHDTQWLLVQHHMSVMICDTTSDRMIFVERTFTLR
ncbi:MAG: hypothetical protein HC876_21685 [Chloroflexaceae bacterium]|nr:hypothetical protein [Chloroflexaceae bacterium]NJO07915.1 hypothetical protein [Chloroflexaceae bacterium]